MTLFQQKLSFSKIFREINLEGIDSEDINSKEVPTESVDLAAVKISMQIRRSCFLHVVLTRDFKSDNLTITEFLTLDVHYEYLFCMYF